MRLNFLIFMIIFGFVFSSHSWAKLGTSKPLLQATVSSITLKAEKGAWKDYFSSIKVYEFKDGKDVECYSNALADWGNGTTMRLISGRHPCWGNLSKIEFEGIAGKATNLTLKNPDAAVVDPQDSTTGCNGIVEIKDNKTDYSGQRGGSCAKQ